MFIGLANSYGYMQRRQTCTKFNTKQKLMDIEKLKYEAQNKALHIAGVSGSALFNADCMDILPLIPDKSVQLILADLPYGITDFKWDSVLNLDKLWIEYKRVLTDNGCVLLHSTQPFNTTLINSNYKWFKYEYIWIKTQASNFLAKKMPLKKHENILVFYGKTPIYNPQMRKGESKMKRIGNEKYQDRKNDMYLSSKPSLILEYYRLICQSSLCIADQQNLSPVS